VTEADSLVDVLLEMGFKKIKDAYVGQCFWCKRTGSLGCLPDDGHFYCFNCGKNWMMPRVMDILKHI
jgi:hypothetical protein